MNKLLREFVNSEFFDALQEFVHQKNIDDGMTLLGMDLTDRKATQRQGSVLGRSELMIELSEMKKKIK